MFNICIWYFKNTLYSVQSHVVLVCFQAHSTCSWGCSYPSFFLICFLFSRTTKSLKQAYDLSAFYMWISLIILTASVKYRLPTVSNILWAGGKMLTEDNNYAGTVQTRAKIKNVDFLLNHVTISVSES